MHMNFKLEFNHRYYSLKLRLLGTLRGMVLSTTMTSLFATPITWPCYKPQGHYNNTKVKSNVRLLTAENHVRGWSVPKTVIAM